MDKPQYRWLLPISEVSEGPSIWMNNLNQAVSQATHGTGMPALLKGDCLAKPAFRNEPALPSRIYHELYGLKPGVYAYRTSERAPMSYEGRQIPTTLAHANTVYLLDKQGHGKLTHDWWLASNQPEGMEHMQAMAWCFETLPLEFTYHPLCLPNSTLQVIYAAFLNHNRGMAAQVVWSTGMPQAIEARGYRLEMALTPEGTLKISASKANETYSRQATASIELIENTFSGSHDDQPGPDEFILARHVTLNDLIAVEEVATQLAQLGVSFTRARQFLAPGLIQPLRKVS